MFPLPESLDEWRVEGCTAKHCQSETESWHEGGKAHQDSLEKVLNISIIDNQRYEPINPGYKSGVTLTITCEAMLPYELTRVYALFYLFNKESKFQ